MRAHKKITAKHKASLLFLIKTIDLIFYFTAAIPGNSFPSKYSNMAPPPVLT